MSTKKLVLEAAHTHTIYSMLVPNGRLLRWADVMLNMVEVIEATDEKLKEFSLFRFKVELNKLIYEPLLALTKAIASNLPKEETNKEIGAKIEEHRSNLSKVVAEVQSMLVKDDFDPVAVKYKLINVVNDCFSYLNKVQEVEYPQLKSMDELLPQELKNV